MARKTPADLYTSSKALLAAIEEYELVTEVKYEVALEVYEAQSMLTRKLLDKIKTTLATYATGTVTLDGVEVTLSDDCMEQSLLVLAVEAAKDMAQLGIRLGSFDFPQGQCATCGVTL